jgi:glycosyltransferase involved in cell wall biosynthesis
VLDQSYPRVEAVVVADGPEATHVDALENEVSDPRLRVVRRSERGGPGAARNTGAQAAKGEYLAFLDDDDEWLPNKLEVQVELAKRRPDAALIFSDAYLVKNGDKVALFPSIKFQGPPTLEELCERNFIPCLTVLLKRDVFMEVGGFDPSPKLWGVDDRDLWLRVLHSHTAAFSPLPLAIHYRHQSNYSNTSGFQKSELRLVQKSMSLFAGRPECMAALRRRHATLTRYDYAAHLEAYEHLIAGHRVRARACVKRAIRSRPFCLKDYAYLLFTYFPPFAYAAVRRLKRTLWP